VATFAVPARLFPKSKKVQRKSSTVKTAAKMKARTKPSHASQAEAATAGDANQRKLPADTPTGDSKVPDAARHSPRLQMIYNKDPQRAEKIAAAKRVGDPVLEFEMLEEGEKPTQRRVRELTAPLVKMRDVLAELGQRLNEKYLLDTARVLEGVLKCLAEPQERDKLSRAATALIGSASALPRLPGGIKTAAHALVDSVREVLAYFEEQFPGKTPTDELLARQINGSRKLNDYRGAGIVLPHDGSSEERESLFADVIRKMRMNSDGGRLPPPEEIIAACARELGNKREIFGANRKRERRKDLK